MTHLGGLNVWDISRPLVVVGMGLGVPINAVLWFRQGCPTNHGFLNQSICASRNIIMGICSGTIIFAIGASLFFLLTMFPNLIVGNLAGLELLPFMIIIAFTFGAFGALVTVVPISLMMQPLTNLVWEKWFTRNEIEIKQLAKNPKLETRQVP